MRKLKSIMSFLLSLILTVQLANFTFVYAANDYDNHWAKSQITRLLNENIVTGYSDGSIKPENNISRAEFVTLTNKLFGYNQKANINFTDVSSNLWYADQFLIAKEAGYLTGDNNGNANPENAITRAEICVIVSKVLNLETVNNTSFTDNSSIPSWAKGYIGALANAKLINGYPDGSFGAGKNITRAEAFVIVNNILDIDNSTSEPTTALNGGKSNSENNTETTTESSTETTTKKTTSSGSGGGGGGSSSSSNTTTTTEAATETTTAEITETTTVYIPSGGSSLTRQEWINSLVNTLGLELSDNINVSNTDDPNYYNGTVLETYAEDKFPYSDISEATYADSIVIAYEYGIITAESSEEDFQPDAVATREFVALTSTRALTFMEGSDDTASWSDSDELEYPVQDSIAVDTGILALENNYFNPNGNLTTETAAYVLNRIAEINTPVEINADAENTIEYLDGVKFLENVTDYIVSDDETTITINSYSGTTEINPEDKIVLPGNAKHISGYSFIVSSVETVGSSIIIRGAKPSSIGEIIESIHIEGNEPVSVGEFIAEDGITVEDYDPEAVVLSSLEGSTGKVLSKKLSFNEKIMNDRGNVSGYVILEIPDIKYKIDAGWEWDWFNSSFEIRDLYLLVDQKTQLQGSLSVEYSENGLTDNSKLKLGTYPFEIAPGLSVNINVWLSVDASGKFTVTYTMDNEYGLQVINNSPRLINNSESDFEVYLEGKLKLGANLGLMLNLVGIDLADISTEAGVGANASFQSHTNPVMKCIDGKIYFYWEISALENSAAGEILNKTFNKEIYNADNSPLKKTIHLESREDTDGFVKVPECTYGTGTLKGYVADARNRTQVIPNAAATIYKEDGTRAKQLYSDSNGEYSCQLKAGNYKLTVTADGYRQFNYSFTITKDEEFYAETLLIINDNDTGDSNCSGKIINSVTGAALSDVLINVYSDWNNTSSEIIATTTTDSNGNYSLTLPSGNYTLSFSKEYYVSSNVNVALIAGDNTANYYLNPENSEEIQSGDIRIVLTWGETPRDLDSHLVSTNGLHTYYSNKNEYNSEGELEADLDRDDVTSYGPETTTIYKQDTSAVYSFYVHDYTNKSSSDSNAMSYSSAQVKVYNGEQTTPIAEYNIPLNQYGTLWHVFDYDASTRTITIVNTFSYESSPRSVGSVSLSALSLFSNELELKDYELAEIAEAENADAEADTTVSTEIENTTESETVDSVIDFITTDEIESKISSDDSANTDTTADTDDESSDNTDTAIDEIVDFNDDVETNDNVSELISEIAETVIDTILAA